MNIMKSMKNSLTVLVVAMSLMAGASAFAAGGGGADGGGRLAEANIARNHQALEAYAANKATKEGTQVASVDK
jgi:hypothetical protein